MPLPVRKASTRTNANDSRKPTSRLAQPSQPVNVRKPQKDEDAKRVNVSHTAEISSSAASVADPTGSSSRIPSPFKRQPSAQASRSQQASVHQPKPALKGHSRQQSAVLPSLSARQKLGHSRSISAVSVGTNASLGSDVASRAPPAKTRFNVSQSPAKAVKTQPVPEARTTLPAAAAAAAASLRGNAHHVQLEPCQNELLQLSIVYKESAQVLRAFERSIARTLAKKQAKLESFRESVQGQKQAFSTASNHLAIASWLQRLGPQKARQSVQELSVVVRDLQTLEQIFEGEDGLAAAFQSWQSLIAADGDSRDTASSACADYASSHIVFAQGLAPELVRFKQQAASAVAALASLSPCLHGSSLSLIVHAHTSLASCLLSQCKVMLQVGDRLVLEHRQWLDRELTAAVDELGTPTDVAGSNSRPAWDT